MGSLGRIQTNLKCSNYPVKAICRNFFLQRRYSIIENPKLDLRLRFAQFGNLRNLVRGGQPVHVEPAAIHHADSGKLRKDWFIFNFKTRATAGEPSAGDAVQELPVAWPQVHRLHGSRVEE